MDYQKSIRLIYHSDQ